MSPPASAFRRNDGKVFEEKVIAYARALGWYVAHFRTAHVLRKDGSTRYMTPVGADGKGFPDLVLVRERILYRELKSGKARLSPEQKVWGERLRNAGGNWGVWYDNDWTTVKDELERRTNG